MKQFITKAAFIHLVEIKKKLHKYQQIVTRHAFYGVVIYRPIEPITWIYALLL